MNGSRENTISCLLYVFRWKPGRNSALLANLHRPDVCLPASGWTQVADDGVRNYPVTGSFELPFRHFEFQRAFEGTAPQTAHAFYCLSEDRASGSPTESQGANLARNVRKPFRMDARRTSRRGAGRTPPFGTAGHPSDIREQRAVLRSRRGIASARFGSRRRRFASNGKIDSDSNAAILAVAQARVASRVDRLLPWAA